MLFAALMIRLILAILLLLIALLAVFRAPQYHLWMLAIAVAEYPMIWIGMTTLVLIAGVWVVNYRAATNIVAIVALVLYLSPIVRAYLVAATLKQDIDKAFGASQVDDNTPLSITRMLTTVPEVKFKTLTFNADKQQPLIIDYYPSAIRGQRPCVIVIHGGSWSSGDSKQLPELNYYLSKKGYNVASINYRLAPQYRSPAQLEDTRGAITFLKEHSKKLNIDTNKLVLLGRSAGAQIALLAAYKDPIAGVIGVIDFYGPADMVWGYSVPASPLVMDSQLVMRKYLGDAYDKMPDVYSKSSPIEFVSKSTIPTLIIHGKNDVLVSPEHSRRLDKKLQQNGINHYYLDLPWATHGFDFNLNGPGGQLSTYAIIRFLQAVTN